MLISSTGTLVRTPVDEISVSGRNTQGVRLIRLAEGERLTGIERVESLGERRGGRGSAASAGAGCRRARRGRRSRKALHRAARRVAKIAAFPAVRRPERGARARIQFRRGAGDAAPGSSRAGARRADRLAWLAACRSWKSATAARPSSASRAEAEADLRELLAIPRQLQGAVPAGRRHRAVRGHSAEPDARRAHRRLRQHRRLVEEGDRRSQALRARSTSPPTRRPRSYTTRAGASAAGS